MVKPKNSQRLGDKGKEIARRILHGSSLGCDQFDFLDPDGNRVKVKTQVRFYAMNSFTINKNTVLGECLTVDRLLFVEYGFKDSFIRLWECTDRNSYQEFTTRGKRKMICWNVNDMKLICEYQNHAEAVVLRKLSKSQYKKL